jgi:cysteine desulfurase family protein
MRTGITTTPFKGGLTMSDPVIYLDNAATSHPKPKEVGEAMLAALQGGGNPGRGGHRLAISAGRRVLAAREAVAGLLGVPDSSRVLFTASATDSLNLALKGLLKAGDHCITTEAEHNAVRRPLYALERLGVHVTRLPVSPEGFVDPAPVQAALRPDTRLIALAHASNVSGAIQPIEAIAEIARRAGVLFLVDAAQTAGSHPIHMERMGIHLLAAPGHKGLLGPQGTGILCVDPSVALSPIREGGTGYHSAAAEQPPVFPEGFESGTVNVPGIAGLTAGIAWLQAEGVDQVCRRETALTAALVQGLRRIPGVTVYGPADPERRAAVVCFNVQSMDPAEVEEALDEEFGVIGRAGLHCNPGSHQALGSFALGGAMRLSPGCFTTAQDVDAALAAVAAIARRA